MMQADIPITVSRMQTVAAARGMDCLRGNVGAVGDHGSHPQRQGEKGVADGFENTRGRDRADVEEKAEGFSEPGSEERVHHQQGENSPQDGHQGCGDALNAGTDAENDDSHRCSHEEGVKTELERGVDEELAEVLPEIVGDLVGEAGHRPQQAASEVVDRPSGDHRVVGEDDSTTEYPEPPHDRPGLPTGETLA